MISRNNQSQSDGTPVHSTQVSPSVRFAGSVTLAVVLLGGCSIGVYGAAVSEGMKMALIVGLMASPFALLGLVMLWSAAVNFMYVFTPSASLTVDSTSLKRGSTLQVHWQIVGRTSLVHSIEILLVGFEKSEATRDAVARLEFSELFKETSIYKTTSPLEIAQGEFSWQVPEDFPLSTGSRPMEWSLRLRGEIASWPDVYSEISIQVVD